MSGFKLYRHALSGHSHRVEVFLSLLGLRADIVDVDLASGEHKQEAFLKMNAFGQVPVLKDGDYALGDSNAILVYLASKYDRAGTWLPSTPTDLAQVQGFLSLAAGPVAYGPAAARLVNVFGAGLDHEKAIATSHHILKILNKHLTGKEWLVTAHPTIADVANYTYLAHAPEGDVSLEAYPNVNAWLSRFERLPGFVPMKASSVGLAA